jgi:hypothetical protein
VQLSFSIARNAIKVHRMPAKQAMMIHELRIFALGPNLYFNMIQGFIILNTDDSYKKTVRKIYQGTQSTNYNLLQKRCLLIRDRNKQYVSTNSVTTTTTLLETCRKLIIWYIEIKKISLKPASSNRHESVLERIPGTSKKKFSVQPVSKITMI